MILMSSVRMHATDIVLLREAAAQLGISQSEFLRHAVKEQATKALKAIGHSGTARSQ